MLGKLMGIKPKTETDAKAGAAKQPAKAVAATTADPAVTALIRGAVVDNSIAAELRKAETLAPDRCEARSMKHHALNAG